jgi:hypothetical protein
MKTFTTLLLTGALTIGANGLLAATNGDWNDQWFNKKYGRNTPATDARLAVEARRSAELNTEVGPRDVIAPQPTWIETHMRVKLGRLPVVAEAHLNPGSAEGREVEAHAARPNYIEQHFQGKLGRSLPEPSATHNCEGCAKPDCGC